MSLECVEWFVGMMVIELLAGTMRLDRGKIAAGEMRGESNGECDYIRNV